LPSSNSAKSSRDKSVTNLPPRSVTVAGTCTSVAFSLSGSSCDDFAASCGRTTAAGVAVNIRQSSRICERTFSIRLPRFLNGGIEHYCNATTRIGLIHLLFRFFADCCRYYTHEFGGGVHIGLNNIRQAKSSGSLSRYGSNASHKRAL